MEIEKEDFLLTIAIPTYNRRNLLKRALKSVVSQLNPKIEVLVSDNASDDGTDHMVKELFPEVRYIRNETNRGGDYNFLQCYREAKGKYVILLGSDDRFAVGALDYLTRFLEKTGCDLVFANFKHFDVTKKEVCIKNSEWIQNFEGKEDIVTADKSQFMKYAGHSITFMSASIAKRSLLLNVKDPERFIGTYFIHTHIMFEAVKGTNISFGVIMQPLIEANSTKGESEMSKVPEKAFSVFGKHMYAAFCTHAVECGFQKGQMRKIYLQYLHDYPFWKLILSVKGQSNKKAMQNFWDDAYPIIKTYPIEWIKTMFAVFIPQSITKLLYKVYKSSKKE